MWGCPVRGHRAGELSREGTWGRGDSLMGQGCCLMALQLPHIDRELF